MRLSYWPPHAGGSADAGVAPPRLYRVAGTMRTPIEVELSGDYRPYLLVPEAPFESGAEYALESDAVDCGDGGVALAARFQVTPQQAVPTQLGTLEVMPKRGPLLVAASGSCDLTVEAVYADLTVELDERARAFADAFQYTLIVDGAPFPTFRSRLNVPSSPPPGTDRVYTACRLPHPGAVPHGQLAPGVHTLRMRARLPSDADAGVGLETPEVSIELRCESGDGGAPSDGGPEQDAATQADSATRADGGANGLPATTLPDAGVLTGRSDASTGAADANDGPELTSDPELQSDAAGSDQGCSATSSRPSTGFGAVLLVLLTIALRRAATGRQATLRVRTNRDAARRLV